MPKSAAAQSHFAPGSICFAAGEADLRFADIAGDARRWTCEPLSDLPESPRHIIRFDLSDQGAGQGETTQYFNFYRAPFDSLEMRVLDSAGNSEEAHFAFRDLFVGPERHQGFMPLPQTDAPAEALIVTLDGANFPESYFDGGVTSLAPLKINAGWIHLLAALICGLLLAPVLFDLGFHRTLREPFPLYHAFFCLTACIQTASISGLMPILFDITYDTERLINTMTFDLMLVATLLFVRSFIEPGILGRFHRDLMAGAAFIPLFTFVLLEYVTIFPSNVLIPILYGLLGAMLLFLFYVVIIAWRRGSIAVRWVTLAFAPLLTIGILRISGALVPELYVSFSEMWAQNFALFFEVVVTSFAVASRFLTIKRERDNAVTEARSLESLSERDALTGLLNRRALEARFPALRAEGFVAIAIVDLDHFKSVNDTYGHHIGDDVLKSAARALMTREDEDLLAFRIGGEEFLLLLRGRAMQARAEERRKEISKAIARETQIDRRVTASMGYLEATAGALASANFESLYERADRLLYEAKEHGRDRMVVEKVTVFKRRVAERRAP